MFVPLSSLPAILSAFARGLPALRLIAPPFSSRCSDAHAPGASVVRLP